MTDAGHAPNDPGNDEGGASLEDGLKAAGETSALIDQIKDLQQQLAQAQAATAEAVQRAEAAEELLAESRVAHQEEAADLRKQLLDMAEAKGKAERKAAKLTRLPRSPKVRKVGPVKNPPDRTALFERLAAGAHVIVFSDGRNEITAFEPVRVEGHGAWQGVGARVMLRVPVVLRGLGPQDREPVIRGFGLFGEDGEQLAWSALPEPIRVHAGGEVKIDRSIIF